MDSLWPFLFLSGICCVVPAGSFTMGLLIGRRGSPLHIKFGWKANKSKEPQEKEEAFRWEEASS
jgi:hypothetical protein